MALELIRNPLDREKAAFVSGVLNAGSLMWLPPDTPFGNLTLKFANIAARLGHANVRIVEVHAAWEEATDANNMFIHLEPMLFGTEEVVFMMKRAADDLVVTESVLRERVAADSYPSQLPFDTIGVALSKNHGSNLVVEHRDLLSALNTANNAHKHSFIQAQVMSVLGRDEPIVTVADWPFGKLAKAPSTSMLPLKDLVRDFNQFLETAVNDLSTLADAIRASDTGEPTSRNHG